jgi:hypothetical protein
MWITRLQQILQNQILYKIKERSIKVGDVGIDVHLDESHFGKRKHNREDHTEGVWWGKKYKRRNFFVITVDNSNAETRNDLSIEYVLPGSIVLPDG